MIIQVPGGSVRIDTLCEFISLAHHLSFSSAAKELNISQPTLSKHISDLEKELNVTLVRRGRKTKLTAAGKAFSDYTLMMLHDYKQIIDKCRRIDAEKAAELRMQRPFAFDDLSSSTMEFTRNYFTCNDNSNFRLVPLRKTPPLNAILDGTLDIGFIVAYGKVDETVKVLQEKDVTIIASKEEPFAVLASKDHPLFQKDRIVFEDILSVPIQMTANSALDDLTKSVQQMFVKNKATARLCIQTVDSLVDLLMAQKRDGSIYLFPSSMLNDTAFSLRNDLTSKIIDDERCVASIFVVAPKTIETPAHSAYFSHLREHLSRTAAG